MSSLIRQRAAGRILICAPNRAFPWQSWIPIIHTATSKYAAAWSGLQRPERTPTSTRWRKNTWGPNAIPIASPVKCGFCTRSNRNTSPRWDNCQNQLDASQDRRVLPSCGDMITDLLKRRAQVVEEKKEEWRGKVGKMTEEEVAAFLSGSPFCRFGCIDDDGWPYVVPCWFEYRDGGFYIVPRAKSAWAKYVQRDARVFLCID